MDVRNVGVMTPLLNLTCNAGHLHFSPTPEAWAGQKCGAPTGRKNKAGAPITCRRPLMKRRKRRARSK